MPSKKTEKSLTQKKAANVVKEDGEDLFSRKKRESQLEKLAINQRFRDRDSEEKFESQLEKLAINQKFRDRDSEKKKGEELGKERSVDSHFFTV